MFIIILYIIACFIFGSTWIAVKIGLQTVPPFTGAVIRVALAFIVFFLCFRLWRFRFPKVKNVRKDFVIAGLMMYGVSLGLVYWGQQKIASSMSALLYATLPFFTGIIAHIMLPNEKFTVRIIIGQLIGFAGTVVLLADDLSLSGSFGGMLALMGSSFFCAWATVKTKRDLHEIEPAALATLQLPFGIIVLLPFMLVFEDRADLILNPAGVGTILYLAILGTGVAFMLWYYLLKRVSAVALSLMTFLEPLVAMFLGSVILGETFNERFFLGGALILVGVLIVTLKNSTVKT